MHRSNFLHKETFNIILNGFENNYIIGKFNYLKKHETKTNQ